MKIAVVGATGLVGTKMTEVLRERNFPVTEFIPVASAKSAGKTILFGGKEWIIKTPEEAVAMKPDIALFSAGSDASGEWAPIFAAAGCRVVDNSSRWRMDPNVKLIVPEVNGDTLTKMDMIIANPNCSTIQMVVALNLLHKELRIKRIVVSTYQSVTGSGVKGINQLQDERREWAAMNLSSEFEAAAPGNRVSGGRDKAYAYPIDMNLIPQIDLFTQNGYTKEEMKMVNETRKIFGDDNIAVSATTVRVPVEGGHSESVNAEFEREFTMEDIFAILRKTPGTIFIDNSDNPPYPMPLYAYGKDEVFVGRVREDLSCKKAVNMWIVADNLRKGAASNAVQIAQLLLRMN
ncbi:MAG: aspartate-semialdehyde dehydrogenase [Bacteroidales bacterium]|jgi:aspartate-semialdehyde dehydrogenase|nr:aspartate-semialdehyde dehydrogenase [Bacteroidales bacterium]